MTDLFLDILNASFAASWVVLAVILARLALKKAPRWMVCGLWALVALRLLMPLMPEAPFSLIPSSEIIPPQSLYDAAPQIDSGVSFIDNAVNPVYTESLRPTLGASVNPLQVWLAVFANIWGLGMIAMAVWALVSCLRVRRQIRERIRLDGNIYLCDRVASPFIFGLLRPILCLPSALEGQTRDHVIAHERAHIVRRDHWWKPIGFLLLTVNWFNPLMWLGYILLCRDIEMACDERVAKGLSVEEKKAYSHALLSCSIRSRSVTVCPLAFGEVGVKMRVKSILHYKKPAFWVILVTAALILVLGLCLLTNPETQKAEIRWDGLLYIQEGWPKRELPEGAESAGSLASTLHDSTPHPNANGQSVDLEWEYAGQGVYLNGDTLYLEQPGGRGWLPFKLKHRVEDLRDVLYDAPWCDIILRGGPVSICETMPQNVRHQLRELLCAPGAIDPKPYADWNYQVLSARDAGSRVITIQARDYRKTIYLTRRDGDWLMVIQDSFQSGSAWTFESRELDAFLSRWEAELAQAQAVFSGFAREDAPVWLEYHSMDMDQLTLRWAVPTHIYNYGNGLNWERKGHVSYTENTICFSCRPDGREDWMELWYFTETAVYSSSIHQSKPISFPNGISAALHYTDDEDRWEAAQLNTDTGQLIAKKDRNNDWSDEEHRLATALLSTVTLSHPVENLMTVPNRLGISLTVSNVTPSGLTLLCTQDGTPWTDITTGADWFLEQWTTDGWVSIIPQNASWPAIAYSVRQDTPTQWDYAWRDFVGELNPGRYRIGKHFTGERRASDTTNAPKEQYEQMCWVEFTLE